MGISNIYGVPRWGERGEATILDGRDLAAREKAQIAIDVARFKVAHGTVPTLATVLIGDDEASAVYVGAKRKACAETGLGSVHRPLPSDVSRQEALAVLDELNTDPAISGILCQLPVPAHLDELELTGRIDPDKDVDGLTTIIPRRLSLGRPGLRPCTPTAVMALLAAAGVAPAGLHAVVIGRSNLFGKPMAQMLTAADATVTLCHSRTRDLSDFCRHADLLIAAAGRPELVRGAWLKPGAVVIDVGINRTADGLVGDVEFESARRVARAITPVPGGVGPMTIAMLLRNTLQGAVARAA
jgi:methylenetetrahydrofolate dehydrogenase (NADP+) / methenyltetrahydrofolate cyclohydrolase